MSDSARAEDLWHPADTARSFRSKLDAAGLRYRLVERRVLVPSGSGRAAKTVTDVVVGGEGGGRAVATFVVGR